MPRGFLFAVGEAAIKKPGRKDISLIVSAAEADMAGTFTTNTVKAAPVRICMKKIKSGRGQAIIVNSGNANACTGIQGMRDANQIIDMVSKYIHVKPSLTYMCSTGVIGTPLPMQRIIPCLSGLAGNVGNASLQDVAESIMTTDTFFKITARRIQLGKKWGTIAGICKGSGMIAPNMATMLCFLITDIAVKHVALNHALLTSVRKSFNRITVDGDRSTNDSVLLMANGMLGNDPISRKSPDYVLFQKALDDVMWDLSRLIVKDGEGATKLIEVCVKGARREQDAEKAAFSIANSSLVKTAIYGNDANWGRIMAALGYSGVHFREEKIDIYFNKVKVVKAGLSNNKEDSATEALKAKEILLTVDLNSGTSSAKVLTCDLTEGYIRINAEYRT